MKLIACFYLLMNTKKKKKLNTCVIKEEVNSQ